MTEMEIVALKRWERQNTDWEEVGVQAFILAMYLPIVVFIGHHVLKLARAFMGYPRWRSF